MEFLNNIYNLIIGTMSELYQLLFILSIVYVFYTCGNLSMKLFARFKLEQDTKFVISENGIRMLWVSIGIILAYLI